jgi:hypothetical protein
MRGSQESRGFQSFRQDRQGPGRTRNIQVPDGLAPSNEYRRGAQLVAVTHPENQKNNLHEVKIGNLGASASSKGTDLGFCALTGLIQTVNETRRDVGKSQRRS